MKARIFILSLVLAACSMAAVAQSSDAATRDKITQAVMKVYDDQLAKEPGDYNTRFARAHQLYYNGDYRQALEDVNIAMASTPANDSELRFDELILRARIYDALGNYNSELVDLQQAHELNPQSLACTDLIAKANLKAGNATSAEENFKAILRSEPMNYDAMYGMALVELSRNNEQEALEHVTKAIELFPAEPQVYVNRADVLNRLGQTESATYDLVQGLCVGDGGNSMEKLFELSDSHYDVVMSTLADVCDKAPSAGMWRYVRANIAMDHKHYGQALKELNTITRNNLYSSDGVYSSLARCQMELGRFDEAINSADKAITMNANNPEAYVVKALSELNRGQGNNYDEAMVALNKCSAVAPQYAPMLLTKARVLIAQGKANDALGYLNAAVANDPTNAEALMTRGYLFKNALNNTKAATRDFEKVTQLGEGAYDLKGYALYELGRDNEAMQWLQRITSYSMPGGDNYFVAAALMSMRGDNIKGMDYLRQALANGYGSMYELSNDQLPYINVQGLRTEADFYTTISNNQTNFQERN